MNETKKQERRLAKAELNDRGIKYQSFNNDLHWKVGVVDFFPTTGRWSNNITDESGQGLRSFIRYITKEEKTKPLDLNRLSIEQLFEIAKKSKDKSLEGICGAIHKEIYK